MNYSNLADYIQLMNEKKVDIESTIKKDAADVIIVEKNIKELREHMKKLKENIKENEENMVLLQKTITETQEEFNKIVKSTNTLLTTVKEKHLPKFKIIVDNNVNKNDDVGKNDNLGKEEINSEVKNEIESYKNNSQPHEKLNNDVDTNDKELPSLFSNKKLKKVELLQH